MSDHYALSDYYATLVGAEITRFSWSEPDPYSGDRWPQFRVQLRDGSQYDIEISRDPEGNGPGFIHGLPHTLNAVKEATH